jgi:hypothetical protein
LTHLSGLENRFSRCRRSLQLIKYENGEAPRLSAMDRRWNPFYWRTRSQIASMTKAEIVSEQCLYAINSEILFIPSLCRPPNREIMRNPATQFDRSETPSGASVLSHSMRISSSGFTELLCQRETSPEKRLDAESNYHPRIIEKLFTCEASSRAGGAYCSTAQGDLNLQLIAEAAASELHYITRHTSHRIASHRWKGLIN